MSSSHEQLAAILAKLEPEDKLMLQAMKLLLLEPILKRLDGLEKEIRELKGQPLVVTDKDKPSPPPQGAVEDGKLHSTDHRIQQRGRGATQGPYCSPSPASSTSSSTAAVATARQ